MVRVDVFGLDMKCELSFPDVGSKLTIDRWSPKTGEVIHESYFDRGDMHLENRNEFIEDFWVRKYTFGPSLAWLT
jgi:hypothetical protein